MSVPSEAREVEKTNRTLIVVVGVLVAIVIAAALYFINRNTALNPDTTASQAAFVGAAARQGAAQGEADQAAFGSTADVTAAARADRPAASPDTSSSSQGSQPPSS
jgi:hypothetical protein